jgi:hypothetical protein
MIGRGDDDGVDILSRQDLAEIGVGIAGTVSLVGFGGVGVVDALLRGEAAGGVDIADREDFDVVAIDVAAEVALHLFSHADTAEREALAWGGRLGPDTTWENERGREEDGGVLEETATGGRGEG